MEKLKEAVRFEVVSTLKYLSFFYCIEYSMLAVTFLLTYLGRGGIDRPYFGAMEICSVIFIFIFGILGFQEDFKMFLQNGFTRRCIFVAVLTFFILSALLLALVDSLAASLLGHLSSGYFSGFEAIYGEGHAWGVQLLYRFELYLVIACVGYLGALVVVRFGKWRMMILGLVLVCLCFMILPVVFREILPDALRYSLATHVELFFYGCVGFTGNETIRFIYPLITFAVLAGIGFGGAYALLRRVSLR